jgi:RNA polymerase sigma-70 factor (ECF subfamily)
MQVTAGTRARSDADLVAACREGEHDAWNELVDRFARYVSAIALQAFRLPPHDAEEVFQTVFLRVYERLDSLRSDEAIRPWVGQLTRNCCLDLLRSSGRLVPVEDVEQVELRAAEDAIGRLDEAMAVRDGLGRLGADCQEILDRFFARDESYRTIGEALSLPSGTIASRISRCLARLRADLEA